MTRKYPLTVEIGAVVLAIVTILLIFVGVWSTVPPRVELSAPMTSVSYAGVWKPVEKDINLEAHVEGTEIQIFWVNESRSLYWKGSFTNRPPHDTTTIQSVGDTKAMQSSMLASLDAEKYFTYKNQQLEFSVTVMGTTKTVHLKRV